MDNTVVPDRTPASNALMAEDLAPGTHSLAIADPFELDVPEPRSLQPEPSMLGAMAGRSLVMQQLFGRMRCTAPHFRLVTVEGEPGTGKLVAAQTLHSLGSSSDGPFVPVLAADFLNAAPALWKEADGGLLYLSRTDELPPDRQRLFRDFLERAAHERLRNLATPGPRQIVVGVTQSLRRLASTGAFRSDLASHLTAIRFLLPPLRERRDDLPLLAALFLRQWSFHHGKILRGFASGALGRLASYPWPGNVRELRSVISAAALDCPGQWIRSLDIPRLQWSSSPMGASSGEPSDSGDDPNLDRAIHRHIVRVLARVNGNKVRAARLLGISRSTLYRLLDPANALPPSSGQAPAA